MGPHRHELWLIRHGETEWSRTGRHTSRTELPLTDTGRRAATALAPVLARRSFALVLTSPLARARETAALAGFAEQAQTEADLVEWDYGEYEGITSAEIHARVPGWLVFNDGAPGGESPAAVGRRAERVVERARAAPGDVL